jgi:hypothetical protein
VRKVTLPATPIQRLCEKVGLITRIYDIYMRPTVVSICALLFLGITGCADHDFTENGVKGVWTEETVFESDNRISKLEYHFKGDGSIEILRIEIDMDSHDVLGYRYRMEGNYQTIGDKISFYNLIIHSNDDTRADYSSIDDLVKVSEGTTFEHTFKITGKGKVLTFIFPPCGPFENCILTKTLKRAN